MIKIEENRIELPVTTFAEMGYCELIIKCILKGFKPSITNIMKEGIKSHDEIVKYEKENYKLVPITQEELINIEKNIEFASEVMYTRYLTEIKFDNKTIEILIYGRADKVMRNKETLIIEDSKFPHNTQKYEEFDTPYLTQILQVSIYLNSLFCNIGSFNPKDWFRIPHKEKISIINIKDYNTKKTMKIFKRTQTEIDKIFLEEMIKRFVSIALNIQEPEPQKNIKKCKACGFFNDCEYKIV
jgi:CRISPR/Cas system-associated exonuclease Cas4 (RecB family)